MNRNKIKKITVWFSQLWYLQEAEKEARKPILKFLAPLTVQDRIEMSKEAMSKVFAGSSGMAVGSQMLPKIEGFNCSWRQDPNGLGFIAQFTFASAEEKKVMKIIEKFGGKLVNPEQSMNQFQIEETDGSGKKNNIELVNEVIFNRNI